MKSIGSDLQRQEAWDKVTGCALYTGDSITAGMMHARILISPHAHAEIKSIDTAEAFKVSGVKAVLTGKDCAVQIGSILEDRPPLAVGKVRYFGEPVALVVAFSERAAAEAVTKIKVDYSPLPVVQTPSEAIKKDAPLIHEGLGKYKKAVEDVYPEPKTNIAERIKIRKGNMAQGWEESEIVVEGSFMLPKSDHIAMETRNAKASIHSDGQVVITTSSQSPYTVKKMISQYFNLDESKVTVKTPLVGGGFGGKAAMTLEILAYLASKAVNGQTVKISNTREEDITSSPGSIGVEAQVRLGATKDGYLKAAEMTFLLDTGAYADIGPRMAKAIAVDCTGPYKIENVWCDSLCVYTNHPYSTSFRGFGHETYTFCMERAMDKLAKALNEDLFTLRQKNAILPGDTTPTLVHSTTSNTGNPAACLDRLKTLIQWDEGARIELENGIVRAKGISCLWKTSDLPTDSISGVLLTFNADGS
ncbi:MAG: coxL, partial [Bacillota bacterium]|nr:coxL [Bacillota bacterium]